VRLMTLSGMELRPEEITEFLDVEGVVLLRETSSGDIRSLIRSIGPVYVHPHSDQDGFTKISPQVPATTDHNSRGLTRARLRLHTDRSTSADPPAILACVVIQSAETGGTTLLADGAQILHMLGPRTAARMILKGDGLTDHAVFEFSDNRRCRLRYRDDDVAKPWDTSTNRSVDITSVVSPIEIELRCGEGYVVHNHRFLHGRTAFRGHREVLRLLGGIAADSRYRFLAQGFRARP